MDKFAIEDGGAMCVGGEEVDQHNDLHLVVQGEPPVLFIGVSIILNIFHDVMLYKVSVDHQQHGLKGSAYQAKKKSVNVSRAVKSANTIQYIIHFTYLQEPIILHIELSIWYAKNNNGLLVTHSLTFLVLTAL